MHNYPLHFLPSGEVFESLVCDVCRVLLGEGITKFAAGKDGGRDAKFVGKARAFPSDVAPLDGRTIIQAKWTSYESSSCSDSDFQNMLTKEEAPKAKKLRDAGELDHWIIFTNRRKSAGADAALEKNLLALTSAQTVHLRGGEDISGFLRNQPHLVKLYQLHVFNEPLRIQPEMLREVVVTIHKRWPSTTSNSSFNFSGYTGIEAKNKTNNLSADYFTHIKDRSEPHFATVKQFLENPRNAKLAANYHAIADEFQHKLLARKEDFPEFPKFIEALFNEISNGAVELPTPVHRKLVLVVLHYMYCNCDIGVKP